MRIFSGLEQARDKQTEKKMENKMEKKMEKTGRDLSLTILLSGLAAVFGGITLLVTLDPVFRGAGTWEQVIAQSVGWIMGAVLILLGATGLLVNSLYRYCRIHSQYKWWAVFMDTFVGVLVIPLAMGVLALLVGGLLYGGALLVTTHEYNCHQNNCSYASTRCGETCDYASSLSDVARHNWEQGIAHSVFWVILHASFIFSGRRLTGSTWVERRIAWQSAGFLLGVVAWLHWASEIPMSQRLTALEGLTLWGIILVVAVKVLVQELFTAGYQYPPDPDLEDPGK